LGLAVVWPAAPAADVAAILKKSVEANKRDWDAAPHFDYYERDRDAKGTKTYHVLMLYGSQYNRLVEVNGEKLPPDQDAEEQRKLEKTIADRRAESPEDRAKRAADYREGRDRDRVMLDQLPAAFDFHMTGEQRINGRQVYVLEATPRKGYEPPNYKARVLTGMRGKLWIDAETFQWTRVEAEVVRPVSIAGFLAKVEPGTRFQLWYAPVSEDIWMPSHFLMRSHARILFLFNRRDHADETYYGYERSSSPNRF
jgi:hypothetical protein